MADKELHPHQIHGHAEANSEEGATFLFSLHGNLLGLADDARRNRVQSTFKEWVAAKETLGGHKRASNQSYALSALQQRTDCMRDESDTSGGAEARSGSGNP